MPYQFIALFFPVYNLYDIVEFYPSISEQLLNKAIAFAEKTLGRKIESQTIRIIKHARQSFLYSRSPSCSNEPTIPWVKKNGKFDVTMGAPDGAEVCELVGLFLIDEVKRHFPELEFGLYRDDGLALHKYIPNPSLERIRKELHNLFGKHGLRVTVETNKTIVNFLDVTLDLQKENHLPYRKPNDTSLYVNKSSNHPPNVLKQIPKTINKRLSDISTSKTEFDSVKADYQRALDISGNKYTLEQNTNTKLNINSKNSNLIQLFTREGGS